LKYLPVNICELKNLNELHAAENSLEKLPELIGFTNLQTIKVSGNKIDRLPASLSSSVNLKNIDVAMNRLRYLPPGFQEHFKKEHFVLHFEKNPFMIKKPVKSSYASEILPLKEICQRLILSCLKNEECVMRDQACYIDEYRILLEDLVSKSENCSICSTSFASTWLECVTFERIEIKNNNGEKKYADLPVNSRICNYECFKRPGQNKYFGIAFQ